MVTKKKKIIIPTLLLFLFQLNIFAVDNKQSDKISENKQTYTVNYKNIPVIYKATGTVESRAEANISPRITSKIMNVFVRSGDHVKKNQILIKLEDSALHASVLETESRIDSITSGISSAKNAVKSSEAVYNLAKTEQQRNAKLYSGKAISQKIYEQSLSNYKRTSAELSRSQQNVQSLIAEKKALEQVLERSKTLFTYSEIKSPIDGIVGERVVDPGDLAIPGKILMKIFDPSKLMLEVPVRESLIKKIKLGETIAFEVKALNKTYDGEIKEIVPYVDTKTRTFLVKICITNSQGLVPGMYGVAKIKIGVKKELLIPTKAITRIGQTETVIVENKNKSTKVFVRTIESSNPAMRIVLSGLNAGDKILY